MQHALGCCFTELKEEHMEERTQGYMSEGHDDDASMQEIAEGAYGSFNELMDKYNVAEEDREEIYNLCKWF
jgi:hypothetical protein